MGRPVVFVATARDEGDAEWREGFPAIAATGRRVVDGSRCTAEEGGGK
jgi:hypothetical protein